jgi:aryl-alcohol dehydrogenase-like predicted oxidoreductase
MPAAQYYTLGRTGLRVSRLALGTMTFGTEAGWGTDRTTAQELFRTYINVGGNLFDTADLYTGGTSETWLGEFIRDCRLRDKAVIATKFTFNVAGGDPNAGGNGRKNILRAVDASLKRLATDYIDLYILHAWDRITPAEEVMRTFDDLIRAGKVRYVALSNVPAWYAARAQTIAELRGLEPLAALQLEYSLVERQIEHEFVPFGIEQGLGILAWSPLSSGLLSGKYRASGDGGAEGRLATMRNNPLFQRFTERNWAIVAELERVAEEVGRSMSQVAINWVGNRPGVAAVLLGATRIEQLEDNLQALDFELPAELLQRLDKVSEPIAFYPHSYLDAVRGILNGGTTVCSKPAGYRPRAETHVQNAS